ncbi:MAG: DUF402 domain-containing protein [Chloroflexi bacterium]|nr:DUF402 domain-containing protein [Chloroflexota bacterium]
MIETHPITVIKQNHTGAEVWRYDGKVITRTEDHLVVEAFFDREDMRFHGMWLRRGDRFLETYYFEHWYNIFEIRAHENDQLRGWYCNVASPAEFDGRYVSYRDLALDLLVFPDGRQLVLDEDEFDDLPLTQVQKHKAQRALLELQARFR